MRDVIALALMELIKRGCAIEGASLDVLGINAVLSELKRRGFYLSDGPEVLVRLQ